MLHIGLLIPLNNPEIDRESGFARSAGSIPIAVDDIRRDHFLDGYNFTFHVKHDDCDEAKAAGYAVELITEEKVHAIIGPTCSAPAISAGLVAAFYNVPIYFWGMLITEEKVHAIIGPTCSAPAISAGLVAAFYNVPIYFWGMVTASVLSDRERFPTASSVVTDSLELAKAFAEVMKAYKWDRFGFIYMVTSRGKCRYLRDDLNTVLDQAENSELTNSFSRKLDNSSGSYVQKVLASAKEKARIFAICFDIDDDRRNFFLEVNAMKMDTSDYVYLMLDTRAYGFGQRALKAEAVDKNSVQGVAPFWIDQSDKPDGRDKDALSAARRALS
uniref:ANF_receptor domain-containing protein n=1 Tax=Steinernema glaseri TaxID=37863 RepID=A0A1I7Y8F8_9BILA